MPRPENRDAAMRIRRYPLALAALHVRCDAERLRRPGRRRRIVDRRCRGGRLEYGFAAVAELRIFLDHAGRAAVDIRDELAAEPHRIARAHLLLLRRMGK